MADQPISGLATYPASPTSATGTSADEIEFLDVNDTSMAATGTNKRVNMADFFSTFITAGAGVSVTKQTSGGGVSIASTVTGLTIGNAVSGGGVNRVLYEDGSSNLAAAANLTFDGTNVNLNGTTPYISTSSTALVLKQTGDSSGTTSLQLQNRSGGNGPVFINSGVDLCDFSLQGNSGVQSNLRYEHRTGQISTANATSGELQLIVATQGGGSNSKSFACGASVTHVPGGYFAVNNPNPSGSRFTVTCAATNESAGMFQGKASQTAPLVALQQVSSLPAARSCGIIDATFNTSTDASWSGNLLLYAGDYTSSNAGKRLGVQIQSDGTRRWSGSTAPRQ